VSTEEEPWEEEMHVEKPVRFFLNERKDNLSESHALRRAGS
jgi:hypothetical protein